MSPTKPLSPCNQPGCPNVAVKGTGRCAQHIAEYKRRIDANRPNARERGYATPEWRKKRAAWLKENPYCVVCLAQGRYTAADTVDHIIPINKGGIDDESNYQGLCRSHHSAKTMRESVRK